MVLPWLRRDEFLSYRQHSAGGVAADGAAWWLVQPDQDAMISS